MQAVSLLVELRKSFDLVAQAHVGALEPLGATLLVLEQPVESASPLALALQVIQKTRVFATCDVQTGFELDVLFLKKLRTRMHAQGRRVVALTLIRLGKNFRFGRVARVVYTRRPTRARGRSHLTLTRTRTSTCGGLIPQSVSHLVVPSLQKLPLFLSPVKLRLVRRVLPQSAPKLSQHPVLLFPLLLQTFCKRFILSIPTNQEAASSDRYY